MAGVRMFRRFLISIEDLVLFIVHHFVAVNSIPHLAWPSWVIRIIDTLKNSLITYTKTKSLLKVV